MLYFLCFFYFFFLRSISLLVLYFLSFYFPTHSSYSFSIPLLFLSFSKMLSMHTSPTVHTKFNAGYMFHHSGRWSNFSSCFLKTFQIPDPFYVGNQFFDYSYCFYCSFLLLFLNSLKCFTFLCNHEEKMQNHYNQSTLYLCDIDPLQIRNQMNGPKIELLPPSGPVMWCWLSLGEGKMSSIDWFPISYWSLVRLTVVIDTLSINWLLVTFKRRMSQQKVDHL